MAGTPATEQEIQEVEREVRGLTQYVVLKWFDGDEAWNIVKNSPVNATHAEAAIKAASEGGEATYVAVPARSWKPMRVRQVQTVQTTVEAIG